MSNPKRILVLILVAAFLLSASAGALAQGDSQNPYGLTTAELEEIHQAEMSAFVDYISDFFDNRTTWRAIGFNGRDISDSFYSDNLSLYQNHNFEELKIRADSQIAYLDNIATSSQTIVDSSPTATLALEPRSTSHYLVFISNVTGGANFEFSIVLTGDYQYNSSTGKLSNAQGPTIFVDYWQYPHLGDMTATNIRRSAYIIDGGERAEFTVTFTAYRNAQGWQPLYCGTFYGKIVGDKDGGFPVEYEPMEYGYPID